jgi:hypothetical protein
MGVLFCTSASAQPLFFTCLESRILKSQTFDRTDCHCEWTLLSDLKSLQTLRESLITRSRWYFACQAAPKTIDFGIRRSLLRQAWFTTHRNHCCKLLTRVVFEIVMTNRDCCSYLVSFGLHFYFHEGWIRINYWLWTVIQLDKIASEQAVLFMKHKRWEDLAAETSSKF